MGCECCHWHSPVFPTYQLVIYIYTSVCTFSCVSGYLSMYNLTITFKICFLKRRMFTICVCLNDEVLSSSCSLTHIIHTGFAPSLPPPHSPPPAGSQFPLRSAVMAEEIKQDLRMRKKKPLTAGHSGPDTLRL